MFMGTVMSDGRKFGVQEDLSAEQRINELDRKFEVIRGRVYQYDSVLSEFHSLETKLDKVFDNHDDILAQFVNFANNLQKEVNTIRSSHESLMNKIVVLQQDKTSQNEIIQANKEFSMRLTDVLKQDIKDVASKNDNAVSMLATSKDLNEFKASQAARHQASGNQIAALEHKFNALLQSLADFQSELGEIKLSNISIKKDIDDLQDQSSVVFRSVDKHLKTIKEELMKMLLKNRQDTIDLMERIREEVLGSPTAIGKIRDEIMNRLEGASLDSSNAVLKTANCETHLNLIEKKIESIFALLKKKELSR
jgi:chromosome segregation ATPase